MKADALWVVEPFKIEVRPFEVEEPKYDEVMFKTMACGLCCWDSWLYRGVNAPGPYPYIIGHEGVGIVERVGEGVTELKPGDNVACLSGNNEMMCEYATVPAAGLVKLPDDVKDWEKVVYEPACCVTNLVNITDIHMGDHVVLVGAGYMGLQTLQMLTRASQAGRITVFELREDRRKMAEAYGAVGLRCERLEDLDDVISQANAINDRPVVVDFIVSADAQVWPMVAAGVSNDEIQHARGMSPVWEEE